MHPSLAADAALAGALVRRAGRLAHDLGQRGVQGVEKTSSADLVTAADHAAEQLVADVLRQERPGDAVVGEEETRVAGSSGRTWYVDPVDGTYNFVSGLGWWCSALALEDHEQVVLGAVHHADGDHVWLGGPRVPTTRDDARLPPIVDRPLGDCSLATYLHPDYFRDDDVADPFRAVAAAAKAIRAGGSGTMDLAAVADRRLDLWCQHDVAPWDWLPGSALVAGAGGATTQVEVRGSTWSLAGPPTAVADAVRALRRA